MLRLASRRRSIVRYVEGENGWGRGERSAVRCDSDGSRRGDGITAGGWDRISSCHDAFYTCCISYTALRNRP